MEVCFTGVESALLDRDRDATSKTYLWMHPIYGATALGLERIHDRLRFLPRPLRALAYTVVIFGAEFASGWLLRKSLGHCPWDYEDKGWSVKGLIRLDYAPFWYGAALLFEPLREAFLLVTREAPRQDASRLGPRSPTAGSPEHDTGQASSTSLLATETGHPSPS
jgi:hypothetical protein